MNAVHVQSTQPSSSWVTLTSFSQVRASTGPNASVSAPAIVRPRVGCWGRGGRRDWRTLIIGDQGQMGATN